MIEFKWIQYELRKKILIEIGLTPDEYEKAIQKIADELGL